MTPEERASALLWRLEHRGVSPDVTRKLKGVLVAAISEAVAEERETCALLAYEYPASDPGGSWRESIGAAIRARKEP